MSRLEELIAELCPDGVEYKPIESFAKAENTRNKDRYCENAYSITQRGLIPTSEYFGDAKITSDDTSNYKIVKRGWFVYSPSRIDVGSINYLKTADEVIVSPLNVVFSIDEDIIRQDYLLYCLSTRAGTWQILTKREGIEGTGRKLLPFERFATIVVPVPPLQVQEELCLLLSQFTGYVDSLKAELSARQKQYEYYRNAVLSFENENVDWLTIGEVFDAKNGYTPSKKVPEYWENGTVPWFRMEDIRTNGRILYDAIQHVHVSGIKKSGLFKKNSIMIATTATLGEHAIIKTDYLSNQQLTNLTIRDKYEDKILPDFAFFYFFIIDELCESVANYSGGIPIVDQQKFRQLPFPVPSIEKQQEIVKLLSRFQLLCNDIQSGLPAEIAARQKQYEYYRDKLLTFKQRNEVSA